MNLEPIARLVAIFTGGVLTGLLIYAFFKEPKIIKWEDEHLIPFFRRLWKRILRFISKQLRKNKRFMAWLNKPAKHGRPDEDWITGQVKVFGDDMWR